MSLENIYKKLQALNVTNVSITTNGTAENFTNLNSSDMFKKAYHKQELDYIQPDIETRIGCNYDIIDTKLLLGIGDDSLKIYSTIDSENATKMIIPREILPYFVITTDKIINFDYSYPSVSSPSDAVYTNKFYAYNYNLELVKQGNNIYKDHMEFINDLGLSYDKVVGPNVLSSFQYVDKSGKRKCSITYAKDVNRARIAIPVDLDSCLDYAKFDLRDPRSLAKVPMFTAFCGKDIKKFASSYTGSGMQYSATSQNKRLLSSTKCDEIVEDVIKFSSGRMFVGDVNISGYTTYNDTFTGVKSDRIVKYNGYYSLDPNADSNLSQCFVYHHEKNYYTNVLGLGTKYIIRDGDTNNSKNHELFISVFNQRGNEECLIKTTEQFGPSDDNEYTSMSSYRGSVIIITQRYHMYVILIDTTRHIYEIIKEVRIDNGQFTHYEVTLNGYISSDIVKDTGVNISADRAYDTISYDYIEKKESLPVYDLNLVKIQEQGFNLGGYTYIVKSVPDSNFSLILKDTSVHATDLLFKGHPNILHSMQHKINVNNYLQCISSVVSSGVNENYSIGVGCRIITCKTPNEYQPGTNSDILHQMAYRFDMKQSYRNRSDIILITDEFNTLEQTVNTYTFKKIKYNNKIIYIDDSNIRCGSDSISSNSAGWLRVAIIENGVIYFEGVGYFNGTSFTKSYKGINANARVIYHNLEYTILCLDNGTISIRNGSDVSEVYKDITYFISFDKCYTFGFMNDAFTITLLHMNNDLFSYNTDLAQACKISKYNLITSAHSIAESSKYRNWIRTCQSGSISVIPPYKNTGDFDYNILFSAALTGTSLSSSYIYAETPRYQTCTQVWLYSSDFEKYSIVNAYGSYRGNTYNNSVYFKSISRKMYYIYSSAKYTNGNEYSTCITRSSNSSYPVYQTNIYCPNM